MKRAFTLIELLVVIAIIAILAAILFPVFAQAKTAAKKTVMLSNAKQFGTSQFLYSSDSDDLFSPSYSFTAPAPGTDHDSQLWSWAVLCQPYIKSYAMLMDPFTPAKITDNPYVLNSQWGMPPRRAASVGCPTSVNDVSACAIGLTTEGKKQLTGGEAWGRDGIAGANQEPGAFSYLAGGYKVGVPSLSSTQVARPADTVLITESNTADLMWNTPNGGAPWNPDQAFRYWGDSALNLFGDNNMTCGPAGRIGTSGAKAGVYPTSMSAPSQFPEGLNATVYTDGHAKTMSWKQMHSQSVSNGTVKYLKYASPEIP